MKPTRQITPPAAAAGFPERLRAATELLEAIIADRGLLATVPAEARHRLLNAAGHVYNPDTNARRRMVKATIRLRKAARRAREERVLGETGIRALRRQTVFTTPERVPAAGVRAAGDGDGRTPEVGARSASSRSTATSASRRTPTIHHFYDQLCPACAEFNFAKRTELADLRGRVALLTGGRVKIGYQAGLKLLALGRAPDRHHALSPRLGARATRASRISREWGDRLEIFGLDLRHTPSVEAFCRELLAHARPAGFHHQQRLPDRAPSAGVLRAHDGAARRPRSTACPTTRAGCSAPTKAARVSLLPEAHAAMSPIDRRADRLGRSCRRCRCCRRSCWRRSDLFPEGRLDQDLQQVDLRGRNSWRLLLAEVSSVELLEVQLVNADRAVHPQRAPQAADAAHAGARQAHRQRVGGRRAVLPELQDHAPSAHQHGQGRAQHDDAHRGDGLSRRRHPHEQRGYRLGDRRGSGRDRRAQDAPSSAFIRRSTSWTARRASSIRSSPASTPGEHVWGQFLKDYRPTDW